MPTAQLIQFRSRAPDRSVAAMIGVGAMIGAGIFVLTGIAAGVAGPGLLIAFLLNGLVTLFTAMAYAELGSCFHTAETRNAGQPDPSQLELLRSFWRWLH